MSLTIAPDPMLIGLETSFAASSEENIRVARDQIKKFRLICRKKNSQRNAIDRNSKLIVIEESRSASSHIRSSSPSSR